MLRLMHRKPACGKRMLTFSEIDKKLLKPSVFYSLFEISKVLARPTVLIFLLGATLQSVQGTQDQIKFPLELTSSEVSEEEILAAEALLSRLEEEESLEEAIENSERNTDAIQLVSAPTVAVRSAQDSKLGDVRIRKVNFLCGLIAMYRPSIADCGKVAKDIVEVAIREDIDPFLVAAVISVESSFNSQARSSAGALGLMQLLPSTAVEVHKKITGKSSYPALFQPETNINLGVEYLKQLEDRYRGNRFHALAAYNWGYGNVDKVIKANGEIPGSVRKYAITILERSVHWRSHFKKAEKSIAELSPQGLA